LFDLSGLTAGVYDIYTSHDGWAQHVERFLLPVDALTIFLESGRQLSGRIALWDGKSADGAQVSLVAGAQERSVVADESGMFRIEHIPSHAQPGLLIVTDTRAARFVMYPVAYQESVTITLEAPRHVEGTLLDDKEAPMANTFIYLKGDRFIPDPSVPGRMVCWEFFERYTYAMTGADGRFSFDRLYDGTYELTCAPPGGSPCTWRVHSGTSPVVLRLVDCSDRPVTLSGIVVDGAGNAVRSFQVVPLLVDEGAIVPTEAYAFEDDNGRFAIASLEEGIRVLTVIADGYKQRTLDPTWYGSGVNRVVVELEAE
jgi:hypothetical protein